MHAKIVIMDTLFKKHRILISQTNIDIVREIMKSVNWEKQLVSIRGSRGVGKTTLMRQYIKQKYGVNAGEALYCVMDSMYFTSHTLMEVAERFHLMGGKHLFLDEVHKYPTWSKELKEINDLWPDMKITFTGSSLLQILNADADLSRRVLSYDMAGLSFREYLRFYKSIELPVHTLQEVLKDADNKSVTKMQKPDKIYVHNPNMLCALSSNLNVGTQRECFVVNQLSVGHTVEYGKTQGDFLIDGKITVEVGGQDKSFDQIADIPNSYILADSMEFPVGKKLPLWVVGLLY